MPWLFLHAIKDYIDMPWYLSKYPKLKATFNIVPSLIEQINDYIYGTDNATFLRVFKEDSTNLNSEDLSYLESYMFLSNEKNMINPLPRYKELYEKYLQNGSTINQLSPSEINDIEVLFLLSWCGNYLRQSNDIVKRLLHKGKYFTQEDKLELINTLIESLELVIPFYKDLLKKGQIGVSTTPFYHPITPLLIDINAAKEARADVSLPNTTVSFFKHAKKELKSAIDYHKKHFIQKPKGVWPSEGSVSLKAVSLFAKYGFEWLCSDEEILFKTLNSHERSNLTNIYEIVVEDKVINVFFRDRFLSDQIGFEYSKVEPALAVEQFIGHLKRVYESTQSSALLNIILDGENAWEYYSNNGAEFFNLLYTRLSNEDWIETVLYDDINTLTDVNRVRLDNIATGSWISGNFDIWIGDEEENRAWELLDKVKKAYDSVYETLDSSVIDKIEKEFMVALGSDWFWWYGDKHFTTLKGEYDELFRKHIINIYQLLNMPIPKNVLIPIVSNAPQSLFHTKPTGKISPVIDGVRSTYFEWINSGFVNVKKELSTMDTKAGLIESFNYGYDDDNLYFLFKGKLSLLINQATMEIELNSEKFSFDITSLHEKYKINGFEIDVAVEECIELKISNHNNESINFKYKIIKNNTVLQSFPIYKDFIIEFDRLDIKYWLV